MFEGVWIEEEFVWGILGVCVGCELLLIWGCFWGREEELFVEVDDVGVVKSWVVLGKINGGGMIGVVIGVVVEGVGRVMGEL